MTQQPVRPEDHIITRKRKKYKFAKFAMSQLCYEFDEWKSKLVDVIEVGAGDGLFSVELATQYPELSFLAIDVKGDRLQKGAYEAEARKLTNVSFVRARADQLLDIIPANSAQSIWLTFPDPFPKRGSAGRRLTHANFLKLYRSALSSDGELNLKHDNPAFFQWSLEQLVANGWHVEELTFDLHSSECSADAQTLTTYERRWIKEGLPTQFVRAR